MENDKLIEVFGSLVKNSRDSGIGVMSSFKEIKPKNPSEDQKALIKLLDDLNPTQQEYFRKSVNYCVELALFKLINILENGISEYSFDLSIKDSNSEFSLINDEKDNELTSEFWNWVN